MYRLDERGGLSRARRAVYHHHVFCPQHLVDRPFLRGVEPRKAQWRKGEVLRLHLRRVEQVAQVCHAVGPAVLSTRHHVEHTVVFTVLEWGVDAHVVTVGSKRLSDLLFVELRYFRELGN